MPSRRPAQDATEKFVIRPGDTISNDMAAFQPLTPRRVRDILLRAETAGEVADLYDVYERMETTDTRYGGLVSQLKSAVSGMPLKMVAAEGASEAERAVAADYANTMQEALNGIDLHSFVKALCDPYFVGAKLYQLRWELVDYPYDRRLWLPKQVAPVEGKYLQASKNREKEDYGSLMVRTRQVPQGQPLSSLPFGSHFLLEDGYAHDRYERLGVARKCLPWYMGLQFVQTWWVQYIESYGAPIRIGRYPIGVDKKAKMDMERFLQVLGRNGYALFPAEMELQLIEANRQGTITTYGDFIRKGHEEYAIAILGQADTVGDKRNGSYARAAVMNSIRYEIVQNVAKIVEKGFREFAKLVIGVNYGEGNVNLRLLPRIVPVVVSPQEMKVKADTAILAQNNGVAVPEDYWYEQILGVGKPRDGEGAVLHGKVFIFNVDPTPEPRATNGDATTQSGTDREDGEGADGGREPDARGSDDEAD